MFLITCPLRSRAVNIPIPTSHPTLVLCSALCYDPSEPQMSSLQEPWEGFKIPILLMKIKAQKDEIKVPQMWQNQRPSLNQSCFKATVYRIFTTTDVKTVSLERIIIES